MTVSLVVLFIITCGLLIYKNASLYVFTLGLVAFGILASAFSTVSQNLVIGYGLALAALLFFNIPSVRYQVLTRRLYKRYRRLAPAISPSEKDALEIGDAWWVAQLFQGRPDWSRLHNDPIPQLSAEERAFMEGPVEELCRLVDDWTITHVLHDLPPEIWQFLKTHGFFGLVLPKTYGGKEFSALAHSEIIAKLTPRSMTLSSTIAVLNSLGPGELIMQYGTQAQKDYYLTRLAHGEEIPCFALTNPEAGSDASAIPDYGIVTSQQINGQEIIGINLNWDKRYITLAPIATVLGLAFKLYDPEHLLSPITDRGITCALIPVNTPGITIGRRHLPLSAVFQNGPTQGRNVFIPLDYIIGGPEKIGAGWHMLMECLSTGRAISLPSSASGVSKAMTLASGAYARIRKQFGLPIGYFEGVEAVLARMIGNTYISEAARIMTTSAIDAGLKPSIASAIVKYELTERSRQTINDAMDIHGGKGICLGPRNYLARNYQCAPIGITVEGANILTRNMIIYSQSLIGCHPYLGAMVHASDHKNYKEALPLFDKAFFGYVGYFMSNCLRAPLLALTQGYLVYTRKTHPKLRRYYRRLNRYCSAFALITDVTVITLGKQLKRREQICGRLSDILSLFYLSSCVLKRFSDEGEPAADLPLVNFVLQDMLYQIEQRLISLFKNFPHRWTSRLMQCLIMPLGTSMREPSDKLMEKVATSFMSPSSTRDRLAKNVYCADVPNNPIGQLEAALPLIIAAEPLYQRLYQAEKEGRLVLMPWMSVEEQFQLARDQQIITEDEYQQLLQARELYLEIIAVDDFDAKESKIG